MRCVKEWQAKACPTKVGHALACPSPACRRFLLSLTMLLSLGLLAAQVPVKITVNTQLVVETVSVTDKNGKPIEGLTAKDFVVTEDGVAQTVSFCEYQKMQEAAPVVPVAAPAPVAEQAAPVTRGQIAPER